MLKRNQGITLIALVVTIIILLILAGVTINFVAGENGILKRATEAVEVMNEAEAREKLEITLAQLKIDKYSVEEYNKETYINQEINKEGMNIVENIVMVDGWKFEIDRDKLQIVSSLGQGSENKKIEIVAKTVSNQTFSKATITYTIKFDGELKSIQINGENVDIPLSVNNEYILEKQVDENGTYTIYVIDKKNGYQMAQAIVSELAEDIEIKTVEELVRFRDKVNLGATYEGKKVTLKNSLDLSQLCNETLGSWIPIGDNEKRFEGNFEGERKYTAKSVYE